METQMTETRPPGEVRLAPGVDADTHQAPEPVETVFEVEGLTVSYGDVPAVRDISFDVGKGRITALIGPSGCGKSTLIRCFNRMNDLIPSTTVEGRVLYHGQDLYGPGIDPVEVRKAIGMVFQQPNPFQ